MRTHAHIFLGACNTSHSSSNALALAQDVWAILCVPLWSHPIRAPCHSWVFLSSLRSLLSLLRRRHRHRWLESDLTHARLRSGVDRLAIWPIRLKTQIESKIVGFFLIANTFRKIHVKWEWIVHVFTRKRRNDLPVLHEMNWAKRKTPTKEKHRLQLWILHITLQGWLQESSCKSKLPGAPTC